MSKFSEQEADSALKRSKRYLFLRSKFPTCRPGLWLESYL